MESFEQKALDAFGEIVINKGFVHQAGFGSKAIPTYVREWIVSHYADDTLELTGAARAEISKFVARYLPDKSEKEAIKNQLFEQIQVKLLDNFSVYVNLAVGDRYLQIPFLDESSAFVVPKIINDNEMLLSSGLWGVGTLFYVPPSDESPRGQIWLNEFNPFQLARVDLDYFCSARSEFSIGEWIDFLVSSMGFNPHVYDQRQKLLLLCRLLPLVEPRYNLVELAPKGTGKSFVFENLSRYVAVRSGSVSPAVLFFNDARKTPGLITRYDAVVIDEAQKVRGDTSGELTALLKSYLESGRFGRGSASSISAEAGIVLLANIDLDQNHRPIHEQTGLFRMFPNFLRETAFIDRISGLLPGWELPKIRKDTPSNSLGMKGDIFGEIIHLLRRDISYRDFVKVRIELMNCDEMRDTRAIEAGAAGMLKILFPHKVAEDADFYKYCVNPALELRQRVRDELCILDREYTPVTFKSLIPDDFQTNHRLPKYVPADTSGFEPESIDDLAVEQHIELVPDQVTPVFQSTLIEKSIHIRDGETGHSYRKLFEEYLKGALEITVVDPYIRLTYQIMNFMALASILDASDGEIQLSLITSADDGAQKAEIISKLGEAEASLSRHGVKLSHSFSSTAHARSITTDTGWSIKLDRGLDIFKKPESMFHLSEVDQERRECKETEIIFMRLGRKD